MRPERSDIAAPPFPPDQLWIGADPGAIERLLARGPVLVHFFEVGEPSGVRTLPYLRGWHERYRGAGLTVLGVHSPRSPLAATPERLGAALGRLDLPYSVAHDPEHRIWRDYGCRGWPSLFLWGRGGALRWVQFGEGAYRETEAEIQRLVVTDEGAQLPDPLEPLRAVDAPGARVLPPSREVLPGGSLEQPWVATAGEEPELVVGYAAGAVYAALDGEGRLEATVDDAEQRTLRVDAPGLYALAEHPAHERHEVRLRPDPGVRVWSVGFAPGLAAERSGLR